MGRVRDLTPSHNIVIRVENIPNIGEIVVDENLKTVGKILDIFGPVSSPYVKIKSMIREPEKLTNKLLYTLPSKRREK